MSNGFAPGERRWRAGMGTLRQVVRQELVARQLAAHLPGSPARRVLDVGCGQGTQVMRLAACGHQVTGVDSSATLLADLRAAVDTEAPAVRQRVRAVRGHAEDIAEMFGPASFDAVLCHGVLMYFRDPAPLLAALAQVVRPGGLVSLLVRNGDALAMRPGLFGDWETARQAFDQMAYRNRIGVTARADRLADLTASLEDQGLSVTARYGVRVFTDTAANDAALPDAPQLTALLACEERAGATDPYRRVAALTHVIATPAASAGLSPPARGGGLDSSAIRTSR
jgi:S-adenosylmethionine-dependent methyltransferase